MSERVTVSVRVRPENDKERATGAKTCLVVSGEEVELDCTSQGFGKKSFTFDKLFGQQSTQNDVFKAVGEPIVKDVIQGYNGTILAYGQTASGKTHTMMGPDGGAAELLSGESLGEHGGLIPRIVAYLFERLADLPGAEVSWGVKVSNFELYKEQIRDLLNPNANFEYKIREDTISGRGIYVENLSEHEVRSADEVMDLIRVGCQNRKVASTQANDTSSRSHSLVKITVEQINFVQGGTRTAGQMNLVDLAGSEKVSKTAAEGDRLKEAQSINLSLTLLGQVIYKLTDGHSLHIPYRDSKLTRILQDSFGGNSRTTLLCACSPSAYNQPETLSTLQFASRAKQIKNKPKINKEMNVGELQIAYAKAQEEIRVLKDKVTDLESNLEQTASRIAGSGVRAAVSLAQSRPEKGTDVPNVDDLLDLIKSLKEEIQEKKQDLLEKSAEITNLKQQVEFYKSKFSEFEGKYKELKDKYITERQASQSWMRKAQAQDMKKTSVVATARRPSSSAPIASEKEKAKPKPAKKIKKPKLKKSKDDGPAVELQEDTKGKEKEEEEEEQPEPEAREDAVPSSKVDELMEVISRLQQSEEASQQRCEVYAAEVAELKQRLAYSERLAMEYGTQKVKFATEMESKSSENERLLKEIDALRKNVELKDIENSEVRDKWEKLKLKISESELSAEEKARLLGSQLADVNHALNALKSEHSRIAALASQLGREANQKELCEVVAVDLMVKSEDLTQLENDVYLLELFNAQMMHEVDESANISKINTLNTLTEFRKQLEMVRTIMSGEEFANPTTESQRITLLFSINEMWTKIESLVRRVQFLGHVEGMSGMYYY